MKKNRTIRWGLFLVTILSVMLIAAVSQSSALAGSKLNQLTIVNETDHGFWLKLNGPAYYYLYVKAGTTKVYTPERGVYDATYYYCGTYVKNRTLDLTRHQTSIQVPSCGTRAFYGGGPSDTVDVGKEVKLVNVTLDNQTEHNIVIVLDGPNGESHAFFLYDDVEKEYTIPKGFYDYKIYGCGGVETGRFYAIFDKVKELTCP